MDELMIKAWKHAKKHGKSVWVIPTAYKWHIKFMWTVGLAYGQEIFAVTPGGAVWRINISRIECDRHVFYSERIATCSSKKKKK